MDAAKGVLGGKLIALNAYIGKKERPKISNQRFHVKMI